MTTQINLLKTHESSYPKDIAALQAIAAGISEIVFQVDRNLKVVWANEKGFELGEDIIGKDCCTVLKIENHNFAHCFIKDSMETGEQRKATREGRLVGDKDSLALYQLVSTPVAQNGKIESAMVVVSNITERYQLEKRLRQNQKMEAVGTLARGIAHDFNNILTPIIGYSEIIRLRLQHQGVQDSSLNEYIDEILVASRRAQGLVEQMLRCSSNACSNIAVIDVHPVVEEVAGLMRTMLPPSIKVTSQVDPSCGPISIDESHLHQILMNLCHNSISAIKEDGGELHLAMERMPVDFSGREWIRISVQDNGCGIEPGILDRVFEPYFTTKEKECGTGMGLAVVHGLVHSQKGYVHIESEPQGGTRVDVFFPLADSVISPQQVALIPGITMGQGRVLLVDDDEQVVEVASELLKSLGYEVDGFVSAQAALSHFVENTKSYDVLVTDLTMPEMTGVELCSEVKSIRSDLPVILCTGYSERLTADAMEKAGVNRYCLKPLALNEFALVLSEVLA